ncbi:hypothetical protein MTR67_050553 [Solanum verrucosum]|uniref:MADS-box domain-containing protein n=1 Tax=Solanum verrucosum TaxID=315347 RepID=A0AAF1A1C4_SOLVR|nr:hypothetical protein MTR67_050553 [Solanum verrucosum]
MKRCWRKGPMEIRAGRAKQQKWKLNNGGGGNATENIRKFWKSIRLGLRKNRMGRKKLEIKRIESKSCRQVAFCKRRNGLIKKAKDLSTLCDVDVAVVIISNRGTLHEFSSTNRQNPLFPPYDIHDLPFDVFPSSMSLCNPCFMKCYEFSIGFLQGSFNDTKRTSKQKKRTLQKSRSQRQLEETNTDGPAVTDLVHLENELQTALMQIRFRKTQLMLEYVKNLHDKVRVFISIRASCKLVLG